jgi:cytochrome c
MSGQHRPLAAGALALAIFAATPTLATGDVEYGAYLAQDCSSCHRKNISSPGIPEIAGLPADYFIQALKAYKEGERDHSTMQMIARSLDEEQVRALAAYYASE